MFQRTSLGVINAYVTEAFQSLDPTDTIDLTYVPSKETVSVWIDGQIVTDRLLFMITDNQVKFSQTFDTGVKITFNYLPKDSLSLGVLSEVSNGLDFSLIYETSKL